MLLLLLLLLFRFSADLTHYIVNSCILSLYRNYVLLLGFIPVVKLGSAACLMMACRGTVDIGFGTKNQLGCVSKHPTLYPAPPQIIMELESDQI